MLSGFPSNEFAETFSRREIEILGLIAEGLSNQTIAKKLYLSLETVKWYNKQIYSKMGVSSRTQAIARAREVSLFDLAAPSPARDASRSKHNLPAQLTSYVGRKKEQGDLLGLLQSESVRLATIVGAGGMGKTRLALQVAREALPTFAQGAWLVDLSALTDPNLVAQSVVNALGWRGEADIPYEEMLARVLQPSSLLLLLDNCEHLVEACACLAEALLGACPQVKVLATSREMLGVSGEAVYPLLPFPAPGAEDSLESLSKNEAVRLFVERAAKLEPGFALTSRNAAAIGRICAQLDGIPLAVELAAAWVRTLPVEQISARLRESLDYLRGVNRTILPRHQTMRGCLDWSYNLLTPPEQNLLQALSVFAGSYTLEAAEAVCAEMCASPIAVLELLDQLAQKSLVLVLHHPEHETRYRLLELVRQYAQEKLHYSGDTDVILDRYLAFYQEMAEQAAPHLRARRQIEWLRRLERELPNIRQALDWAYSEEGPMERIERGLRLAADLRFFWQSRVRFQEGIQQLNQLLDLEKARRGVQPLSRSMCLARAWALLEAESLMGFLNARHNLNYLDINYEVKANLFLDECASLFQSLGELGRRGLAYFRIQQMDLIPNLPPEKCIMLLKDIYAEAELLEDRFLMVECQHYLAQNYDLANDLTQAERHLINALDTSQEIGDLDIIPYLQCLLAFNTRSRGKTDEARAWMARARSRLQETEVDLLWSAGVGHELLFTLSWCMGEYVQAEQDYVAHILALEKFQKLQSTFFNPAGIAASQGDYGKTRAILQQHIEAYPIKSWGSIDYWGLYLLGELDWAAGDYTQAVQRFTSLKKATEWPDFPDFHPYIAEWGLAKVALSQGDWNTAADQLNHALNHQVEKPVTFLITEDDYAGVTLTAVLSVALRQYNYAARLLGAADRSYQLWGKHFPSYRQQLIEKTIADTRAALDEAAFTAAWEEGKALSMKPALKYALQVVNEIKNNLITNTTLT